MNFYITGTLDRPITYIKNWSEFKRLWENNKDSRFGVKGFPVEFNYDGVFLYPTVPNVENDDFDRVGTPYEMYQILSGYSKNNEITTLLKELAGKDIHISDALNHNDFNIELLISHDYENPKVEYDTYRVDIFREPIMEHAFHNDEGGLFLPLLLEITDVDTKQLKASIKDILIIDDDSDTVSEFSKKSTRTMHKYGISPEIVIEMINDGYDFGTVPVVENLTGATSTKKHKPSLS